MLKYRFRRFIHAVKNNLLANSLLPDFCITRAKKRFSFVSGEKHP